MNTTRGNSSTALRGTKRLAALGGALLLGLLGAAGTVAVTAAVADAPAISQCSYADNTPGLLVACDVTVNNNLNLATGATSSVTVVKECHGVANTTPSTCATRTLSSGTLVSAVEQCNDSVNGGGATLICNVTVVNNVTGAPALTGVTVNQCIGTGGGGGANPNICSPIGSTTNATVTQCNGSANGGGGEGRVKCSVSGPGGGSAILVRVTQCNGSANGGGSTVTCSARLSNVVTAAAIAPSGGSGKQSSAGASTTEAAATATGEIGETTTRESTVAEGSTGGSSAESSGSALSGLTPEEQARAAAELFQSLAFTGGLIGSGLLIALSLVAIGLTFSIVKMRDRYRLGHRVAV